MERWNGKVAVVTGASAGIGAAIVTELLKYDIQVVGIARRISRVQDLANTLANYPGKLYSFQADMRKEEEIIAAFNWIKSNLGGVDILVNNAGTTLRSSLSDGNTEDWRRVFETNVLGLCIATREAIKSMKERNIDGQIIHINSILGHGVPNPLGKYTSVYPSSKHAVTALTEVLRQELVAAKSKIKISSVSPGFVATEIVTTHNLVYAEKSLQERSMLDTKNVADAVIYVISTPPNVQISELILRAVGETL